MDKESPKTFSLLADFIPVDVVPVFGLYSFLDEELKFTYLSHFKLI